MILARRGFRIKWILQTAPRYCRERHADQGNTLSASEPLSVRSVLDLTNLLSHYVTVGEHSLTVQHWLTWVLDHGQQMLYGPTRRKRLEEFRPRLRRARSAIAELDGLVKARLESTIEWTS